MACGCNKKVTSKATTSGCKGADCGPVQTNKTSDAENPNKQSQ